MGLAGRSVRRSWRCWSPLVSGQLLAWLRELLVMLMVRVVQVIVLFMQMAKALQALHRLG